MVPLASLASAAHAVWEVIRGSSDSIKQEKAAWSRDSRLMVETFDTRFSTDGVTAYAIGADDKVSTLDLLKIMEPAARAQLKRRIKSDDGYVLFVQRIAIDNRGRIRVLVHLWVPKEGRSRRSS